MTNELSKNCTRFSVSHRGSSFFETDKRSIVSPTMCFSWKGIECPSDFSVSKNMLYLPVLLSLPTISRNIPKTTRLSLTHRKHAKKFRTESGGDAVVENLLFDWIIHCYHHCIVINGPIIRAKMGSLQS